MRRFTSRLRAYSTMFGVVLLVGFIVVYIGGAMNVPSSSGDTYTESLVETTDDPPGETTDEPPPTAVPTSSTTPFVCNPDAPIQRVNVSSSGAQTDYGMISYAQDHSISDDGRYIVFTSQADNLAPGITNNAVSVFLDVFLHDRLLCQTTRLSMPLDGVDDYAHSFSPLISANGQAIIFQSYANNLTPGNIGLYDELFLYDATSNQLTNISDNLNVIEFLFRTAISPSGRYISFQYQESLDPDFPGQRGTYVLDVITNTIRLTRANNVAFYLDVDEFSRDERYIVGQSHTSNLIPGDEIDNDIFRYDLQNGSIAQLNLTYDGIPLAFGATSYEFNISEDGRYIVFSSNSSQEIAQGITTPGMIYRRDTQTGEVVVVSTNSAGQIASGVNNFSPRISDNGRYIAFASNATNFGTPTSGYYIYVKDMQTGALTRTLPTTNYVSGNISDAGRVEITPDGRWLVITSNASNLVPDDINNAGDVFVVDWQAAFLGVSPTATITPTLTNTAAALPSVIISRTSMTLTEGGVSILYNARLSQAPAPGETIIILPTGYDAAQISLSPAMRLLNASNWNTGRNFTVTAVNDPIPEVTAFTTISHTTTSNQPASPFNGVTSGAINVTVLDNDAATETPTSEMTTDPTTSITPTETETPLPGDYTPIVPATPTNFPPDYYVTQTANAIQTQFAMTETAAMSTATSTPTATATATITLTLTATTTFSPSPTLTPTHTATSSTAPQIIVTRASFAVTEGGAGVTYNVRLSQSPAPGETVTLTATFDATQISVSPIARQLNNTNWNTGRSITVTAVNDTTDEAEVLTVLTHSATSSQPGSPFNGISGGNINISVVDND